MKEGLLTVVIMLLTITVQAQHLRVAQIDLATSIENREPVGVDTVFSADVGSIFCFTQIENATDTTHIEHVWYYKDEEKADIRLDVKSEEWRTWSSKTILQSWTGHWRVMVKGPDGNVLATKNFVIR